MYYDTESGQLLFGIPSAKDDETQKFLGNLVEELIYTTNPDGMEC